MVSSFTWNCKGKVFRKVVLKEGWSFVRGSFTWNRKGKVFRKVVLKEGWSFMRVVFHQESYSISDLPKL